MPKCLLAPGLGSDTLARSVLCHWSYGLTCCGVLGGEAAGGCCTGCDCRGLVIQDQVGCVFHMQITSPVSGSGLGYGFCRRRGLGVEMGSHRPMQVQYRECSSSILVLFLHWVPFLQLLQAVHARIGRACWATGPLKALKLRTVNSCSSRLSNHLTSSQRCFRNHSRTVALNL